MFTTSLANFETFWKVTTAICNTKLLFEMQTKVSDYLSNFVE